MTEQDSLEFFNDVQKSEKGLLGAILLQNRLMHFALDQLSANSFMSSKHRMIFAAMVELYKKVERFDANSVVNELIQHEGTKISHDVDYVLSLEQDVPISLTVDKADYIERFILVVSMMAIQAAALEEMSVDDVIKVANEKFRYAKRLMGIAKDLRALPQRTDTNIN